MVWVVLGFLVLVFLTVIAPLMRQRSRGRGAQPRRLSALQRERGSQVITIIHRQEQIGLFGVPLVRFIDIDDSEQVLRAIRLTPDDRADRPGAAHAGRAGAGRRADRTRGARPPGPGDRAGAPLRDERRHPDRAGRRRDRDGRRTPCWDRSTRSWATCRRHPSCAWWRPRSRLRSTTASWCWRTSPRRRSARCWPSSPTCWTTGCRRRRPAAWPSCWPAATSPTTSRSPCTCARAGAGRRHRSAGAVYELMALFPQPTRGRPSVTYLPLPAPGPGPGGRLRRAGMSTLSACRVVAHRGRLYLPQVLAVQLQPAPARRRRRRAQATSCR